MGNVYLLSPRSTRSTLTRALKIVLPFLVLLTAHASFGSPIDELPPDQLHVIDLLRQEVIDTKRWRCDQFKDWSWATLAKWLSQYLTANGEAGFSGQLKNLDDPNFRGFVPANLRNVPDELRQLQTICADADERVKKANPNATDEAVAAETKKAIDEARKKGQLVHIAWTPDSPASEIKVELPSELVEVTFFYKTTYPWLLRRVKDVTWQQLQTDGGKVILSRLVAGIRDYELDQRRLATLELLLRQEPWVKKLIGLRDADMEAVVAVLRGEVKVGQNELEKTLIQLEHINKSLDDFYNEQTIKALGDATHLYQTLYSKQSVDFGRGNAFIRARILPLSPASLQGNRTVVSVELSLCRLMPGSSAKGLADTQTSTGATTEPASPLVDEIPLGITVTNVDFQSKVAGQPPDLQVIPLPLGSTQVEVNPQVLREALRRLGIPEAIDLVDASAIVHALDDIEIAVTLRAPGFSGGLSAANQILQGSGVKIPPIHITREGVTAKWSDLVNAPIAQLQHEFVEKFNPKDRDVISLSNYLTLLRLEPGTGQDAVPSKWTDGVFRYTAVVRVEKLPLEGLADVLGDARPVFRVPLELRQSHGKWSFWIGGHEPASELIDALRRGLAKRILDKLATMQPPEQFDKFRERLDAYFTIKNAKFEQVQSPDAAAPDGTATVEQCSATIVFSYPMRVNERDVSVNAECTFVVRLSKDGNLGIAAPIEIAGIDVLLNTLKGQMRAIVNEILETINGKVEDAVVTTLNGKEAELFGAKLKLIVSREDAPGQSKSGRVRIDVDGRTSDGMRVRAEKVYFISPKLDAGGLKPADLDFGEAKLLEPQPKDLVQRLVSINPDWLKISQVRFVRHGLVMNVEVYVEALATEVDLGEVSLGLSGVNVTPVKLKELLGSALKSQLKGKKLQIGDIGPVEDIDVTTADNPVSNMLGLDLVVTGQLNLDFVGTPLRLPISATIAPRFGNVRLKSEEAMAPLTKLCEGLLSIDGVKVENLKTHTTSPYGVSFDLTAKVLDTVEISVKDVSVTTKGVTINPCISVALPGIYPLGSTGLVLIHPGLELRLREVNGNKRSVFFIGDITLASEGIDKIVKLHGKIGATIPITRLESVGTVVLVSVLPVFETKGGMEIKSLELKSTSQVVGLLAKLVDVKGENVARAKDAYMKQDAAIKFVGIHLADTSLEILGKEAMLRASGMAKIPLTEAKFNVQASPNLGRVKGSAHVGCGVGSFSITGDVALEPSVAEIDFGVLGFKICLITPGVSSLTPHNVLKAIENIFDIDISSFLNAIKHRKIVVSLLPPAKGAKGDDRPVGKGDPVPESNDQPPQTGTDAGAPPPPGGDKENKERHDAMDYRQQTSGEPLPPGNGPKETGKPPEQGTGRPEFRNQVIAYQLGNAVLQFKPHGQNWIAEVQEPGGWKYEWHFEISDAVKRHLVDEQPTMMVTWMYDALPMDHPVTKTCRNGFQHTILERVVTVRKDGTTWVCDLYSGGEPHELTDLERDWGRFADAGLANAATRFDELAKPDKHLLPGDLALLRDIVRARLTNLAMPQFERVIASTISVMPGIDPLEVNDGYIYHRMDPRQGSRKNLLEARKTCVYQARSGASMTLPVEGALYRDSQLEEAANPFNTTLRTLLPAITCSGTRWGYVAGKAGGPVLLAVDLPNRDRSKPDHELLALVQRNGGIKWSRRLQWMQFPAQDSPLWNANLGNEESRLPDMLLTTLDSGAWDDVIWSSAAKARSVAVVRGLNTPATCTFQLFIDGDGNETGHLLKLPKPSNPAATFGAAVLGPAYKGWLNDGLILQPPKADIGSREWILWLIHQVLDDEKEWPKIWKSNPRKLAISAE